MNPKKAHLWKQYYKINVFCPYCRSLNTYLDMELFEVGKKLECKNCNETFELGEEE